MNKNQRKKIGVAGNHKTTIDLLVSLLKSHYEIECIINMGSDLNGEIAGYTNIAIFAKKHKIRIIRPKSYSLVHEDDVRIISKQKLDILLVCGWQRLIPEWLLEELGIGAFGTHGSWKNLPYGRGRSLMNWGLLLGKNKIIDNFFKYDVGADSGDIIDTLEFEISPWDSISTLHHKDQLVHQTLLLKHLPDILNNKMTFRPQSKTTKEVFFPKRSPDDGVIDWSWTSEELYNLVRALSKPYPGAFTYAYSQKIFIWRAIPFNFPIAFKKAETGEIIASFSDGTFVVRTKDGAFLIQDYEPKSWKPSLGSRFESKMNNSYKKLRENNIKW